MAETQVASTGWGGEFWLSSDDTTGSLAELVEVVSFGIPEVVVDQVESTHLKSADRFKEFIDGLADGGEAAIVFNFRPGSDTDAALDEWETNRGRRKIRFGVPLQGTVVKTYTCSANFAGYNRGEVTADGKMEATLRVKLTGSVTKATP